MRIVALDSIKPDMVLGRDVYDSEGRVLLARGCSLHPHYARRLTELGITFIYINDGRFGDVQIDDVIAEETRREAAREVRSVMAQIQRGEDFSTRKITESVNSIIDELLANPGNLLQLTDIRAIRDYTFSHSVSVAIASLVTGVAWGYDQRQLATLGAGALLHDVGKSLIPETIVQKRGELTPDEMSVMKRHPTLGYEALKKRDDLSPVVAHVAWQHHERLNGAGYPRGLKGAEIHEYARITALADVFDAMTTDRVYRTRHLPHVAVEFLATGSGLLFDPEMVKTFIDNIALYPTGTLVRLSNQQVGIVVKNHRSFPTRPVVRVSQPREDGSVILRDLDLTRELTLFIVGIPTEGA